MEDLISRQAAIDKIRKRLFETAFNNVGIKQNIDETLEDVAENRLENWFNELPSVQPDTTTHDSIPAETGKNDGDRTTNDLISRQAVLNATSTTLRITGKENAETVYGYIKKLCDDIKALPSAQPEHKTGHWIPVTNGRGGHQCDRCGCYAPSYQSGTEWLSNFCPECNADMRGKQE